VLHVKSIIKIVEFSQICQSWKFSARGFFPEPEFFWRSGKTGVCTALVLTGIKCSKVTMAHIFRKEPHSPRRKFLPSGGGENLFLIIASVLGHPKGVGVPQNHIC
jgi:hypothetical protein